MNKRLKRLLIKTRRKVFTEMIGNNPSLFHGEGYDFSELREYQIGDDIRKIDWTITAKLQKPYVKLFHEERELNIVAACMMGGSLFFGTKRIKQDIVAEIVAILGYSCVKNSDLFRGAIVTKNSVKIDRPTKRLFGIERFVEQINDMNVLGIRSDYSDIIANLFSKIKRRSVLFLIGDFLSPVQLGLLSRRHEVVAIIVRDRFEEYPKPLGQVHLVDPETSMALQTSFGKQSVEKYRQKILENDAKLYKHLYKNRIRFIKIYTDEDPFGKLIRLFGGHI